MQLLATGLFSIRVCGTERNNFSLVNVGLIVYKYGMSSQWNLLYEFIKYKDLSEIIDQMDIKINMP